MIVLSMCISLLAERPASDEPEICNLIYADVLTLLPALTCSAPAVLSAH